MKRKIVVQYWIKESYWKNYVLLYIIENKSERYLKKLMKGLKYPMVNVLNWILLRHLSFILKENASCSIRNIRNFSDFKGYICSYYGVANPSYKKNDCLVCVGMSPSRFDELYNDNGAFWNLCLRKNNQY